MNKKTLIVGLAVVVAGVMLGIILSLPNKSKVKSPSTNTFDNSATPNNSNNNQPIKTQQSKPQEDSITTNNKKTINVTLEADPTSIKSTGQNVDIIKDFAKIDKSTLKITYANSTGRDLTGIQLWIGASGVKGFGTTGVGETKYNKELSSTNKRPIFDVPSLKAGSKGIASIKLYSRNPGSMQVTVLATTKDGLSSKSNSVKITVN